MPRVDGRGQREAAVKLATQAWELNIRAPLTEFMRLRDIRDANWGVRHSLAVGTSAGASVFWASSEGEATILVGHDDETWDMAVTVPLAVVDEIVSLATQES
jgi:hypothetical protein